MKTKNGLIAMFLLLITFVAFGCKAKPITMTFAKTEYEIGLGDELTLTPELENTTADMLEYFIEDDKIVSIENNVVKGLKIGSTTVTVNVKEHLDITATLSFEVKEVVISVDKNYVSVGKTRKINLKVNGSSGYSAEWTSSNTATATIDATGTVTGVAVGTTTITAKVGEVEESMEMNVLAVDTVAPELKIDLTKTTQDVIINYNEKFNPLQNIIATDNRDGDIIDRVQVEGGVNTVLTGEYVLTYTLEDEDGNKAEPLVRKITVVWDYDITFIGHAGCYSGMMNTEDAFIKAATVHGYQAIECDLKQTKDGVFVTCHDDVFGKVSIPQTNWNDLKDVETSVTRGGITYTSKICTLERYLEICKQYNVTAVIELKDSKGITNSDQSRMPQLMDLIKKVDMLDNVIFLTSQYNCLIWTRNNGYKDIPCQYLVNSIASDTFYQRCIEYDTNTQEWIDKYHAAGKKISCWTFSQYKTVQDLQKYINMGVDFVTCDQLKPFQPDLTKRDKHSLR